jgi:hypothetical protein
MFKAFSQGWLHSEKEGNEKRKREGAGHQGRG